MIVMIGDDPDLGFVYLQIVSLLVESGVDINLRNYPGQWPVILLPLTWFGQSSWIGHPFEYDGKEFDLVVRFCKDVETRGQTGYVDIGRFDPLSYFVSSSGNFDFVQTSIILGTWIHLLVYTYRGFTMATCQIVNRVMTNLDVHHSVLHEVINRAADGLITPLHVAALNGHIETVQLLLDLGTQHRVTVTLTLTRLMLKQEEWDELDAKIITTLTRAS
ncbi:unnamed protein product [Arabidopsis arenosa]|uniref:Ankyrin repeat family protein n=1 Tax=Arabidopsis arenosa TaxID=38785 RepID=A0A8S2AKT5_ARAAE|nr:unnamed protein product [Arabidopsis arenosa]